jgi:hypothetical protein
MAGIKIVDLPAVGRDLAATDLFEMSLVGGTGSRKITGQEIMNASKLSVGSTPVINGSGGGVFFQGTGNVLQQSPNITWNNPSQSLYIGASIQFGGNTDTIRASGQSGNWDFLCGQPIRFLRKIGEVEIMRIVPSTTNVLIGTTTDAGFKLDVNGTARVNAQLEVNSVNSTQGILLKHFALATTATQIYYNSPNAITYFDALYNYAASTGVGSYDFRTKNASNVLTSRLFIQGWDGSIGIGTTTPAATLDVNGTARVSDNLLLTNGIIATSAATTRLQGSLNYFTHNRIASSGTFGFQISSNGILASFWRWDSATYDTEIGGAGAPLSGALKFFTAGTEKTRITSGGNILINTTTDAGFRLDVNGTARFIGRIDAGSFTPGVAASQYTIATTGRICAGSGIYFRSPIFGDFGLTGFYSSNNDTQVNLILSNSNTFAFAGGGGSTATIATATPTFNPSSGTGNKNIFEVAGTYQTSGTYSGVIRGFFYNPTLISMTGVTAHFAWHSTSGRFKIEGLPTSPTGLTAGELWNNGGVINIV